jgi:molybdopterin-guanine dinucleotide biosynthesis protein A
LFVGCIILAGGNGTRIGKNKAFIKLNGKSFLQRAHDLASLLTDEIVVVIGGEDPSNLFFGSLPPSTIILNDIEIGIGPIMGIYSGMKVLSSSHVVVLPCDSPLINIELMQYLIKKTINYDALIPKWPNGFIEPLHSIYKVASCLEAIKLTLEQGEKSLKKMINRLKKVKYVSTDELKVFDRDLRTFYNINSQDDLIKFQDKLVFY